MRTEQDNTPSSHVASPAVETAPKPKFCGYGSDGIAIIESSCGSSPYRRRDEDEKHYPRCNW